jgi:hypothetical protein
VLVPTNSRCSSGELRLWRKQRRSGPTHKTPAGPSHSCAKRRGHCGGHFAPRLLARRTTHAELWHNLPIVSQRNTSHGHAILHDELVRAFRRAEIPHAHLSKLRFHFVTHKECS